MGNLASQMFPPAPQWTPANIPNLSGKVAIVTGANTGIGKETAKELLAHNAKVYVAARSKAKADVALAELKRATGKDALFLELDLSDLVSVKRAAEAFLSQETGLNILVASAGVMFPPMDQLTKQGYDLQLGTNVLGHWYLTKLLLPALRTGVEQGGARVAIVASSAADLAPPIDWDAFTDSPARTRLGRQNLYKQSKLLSVMIAMEFAARHGGTGIVFSSLNPGNFSSDLQRHSNLLERLIVRMINYDVEHGALTSLYAATAPEANVNGAYYIPWARPGTATSKARDAAAQTQLWAWLEEQVKDM